MLRVVHLHRIVTRGFLLLSVGLSFLGSISTASAADDAKEDAAQAEPIRVFFIGNSQIYFNDLPKIVEAIADSAPADCPRIKTDRATYGGATLEAHWNKGADNGHPRARISKEKWDFVVLQDYGYKGEDTIKYSQHFHESVRERGEKSILLCTANFPNPYPQGFQELLDQYLSVAKLLKVPLAAGGKTWMVYWGNNPSLADRLDLYHPDKGHPGYKGSYAYACTLYPIITGKNPIGLTNRIPGQPENALSPDQAKRIQESAWQVHQEINGQKPVVSELENDFDGS